MYFPSTLKLNGSLSAFGVSCNISKCVLYWLVFWLTIQTNTHRPKLGLPTIEKKNLEKCFVKGGPKTRLIVIIRPKFLDSHSSHQLHIFKFSEWFSWNTGIPFRFWNSVVLFYLCIFLQRFRIHFYLPLFCLPFGLTDRAQFLLVS